MLLYKKLAKKSCTEVLDSGLQLKVWGVQTSRKLLSEIVGNSDDHWKQWMTINDYCLYVTISDKNGGLTNAEKKYCDALSLLLKKEVQKMRSIHNNSASDDPVCGKILGLERAILTLQNNFKPYNEKDNVTRKVEKAKQTREFWKKTGALNK